MKGPGPGGKGPMHAQRAKDFKGAMRKLLKFLGKYKLAVLAVMVFAALSTVFSIVGPKILGEATQTIGEGVAAMARGTGGIDFSAIGRILLTLLALYGISALFAYLQGFIMTGVSMKITYQLRQEISRKIHRIPLKYFESTSQGEVISRVTNDVDTVSQSLNQSITQIITSATSIIGVLIMMLSISVPMALTTLLIVPFSMVLTLLIVKRSQKYFIRQQNYLGHVNGHIEETYGGQSVIRAFRGEKRRVETFGQLNDTLYDSAWKSQFLSGLIMPATSLIGNLGYVAVCVLGAYLAGVGSVNIGNIQAFLQYVRSFNQPISQVANISNVLQQTMAAAERVFDFLEEEEEAPESQTPVDVRIEDGAVTLRYTDQNGQEREDAFHGEIVFDHVSFGYSPDKTVIRDFSARVAPGQKVAIVGPTGAGKTTIVKLLMRFYDVGSGSIRIDGHDIRDFTRQGLRSLFGMVLQDTWLYHDTIRENIRYGRRDASDHEVELCAKAARVEHFVKTLPGGYDVEINEEATNISQGQKQLLTIARAILADPKILILDEATSSVDTKTEIDIQRAMDHLMERRTSFVIAHRLSTIRDCQLILVMQNGDIVEQGGHEELLRKNGAYAALYNAQFDQAG